jgi:hypothetical protein
MAYVKSLIAGILVMLCGALLTVLVLAVGARIRFGKEPMITVVRLGSPTVLGFLVILFLLGFGWEFWRLYARAH